MSSHRAAPQKRSAQRWRRRGEGIGGSRCSSRRKSSRTVMAALGRERAHGLRKCDHFRQMFPVSSSRPSLCQVDILLRCSLHSHEGPKYQGPLGHQVPRRREVMWEGSGLGPCGFNSSSRAAGVSTHHQARVWLGLSTQVILVSFQSNSCYSVDAQMAHI